jgi:hypothetical protein
MADSMITPKNSQFTFNKGKTYGNLKGHFVKSKLVVFGVEFQ